MNCYRVELECNREAKWGSSGRPEATMVVEAMAASAEDAARFVALTHSVGRQLRDSGGSVQMIVATRVWSEQHEETVDWSKVRW